MKKSLILLLLAFAGSFLTSSQTVSEKKQKAYQVWIKLNNNPLVPKGYLWEVGDSSVFLVQSLINPEPREFSSGNMKWLKIRRDWSVLRGAITGSVAGASTGIILVNSIEGGLSYLAVPVSSLSGLVFGLMGAGIGALTGSVKDRIPIQSSPGIFSRYKGSLLEYSWLREQITAPTFEHRGYIGFEWGISFAGGEFATLQNIPLAGYSAMKKTGTVMYTQGGYRFTRNFGINLALINQMYSLELTQDAVSGEYTPYWGFDALIISPVLTWPFHEKWRLDFSPGIGYAGTTLSSPEDFVLNGEGFGYHLKGSLSWHYAKRWTASLGSSYLSSEIKYREGGSGRAQAFSISAGVVYLFGKKSLSGTGNVPLNSVLSH